MMENNIKLWMSASNSSFTSKANEGAIVLVSNEWENRFYLGSMSAYEDRDAAIIRIAENGREITLEVLRNMVNVLKSSKKYVKQMENGDSLSLNALLESVDDGEAKRVLLVGSTGTGKTTVALGIARRFIEAGVDTCVAYGNAPLEVPQDILSFDDYNLAKVFVDEHKDKKCAIIIDNAEMDPEAVDAFIEYVAVNCKNASMVVSVHSGVARKIGTALARNSVGSKILSYEAYMEPETGKRYLRVK
jgi:Cdc6-like AAA superfamily ATPase